MLLPVVIKKNKKWILGILNNNNFKEHKQVKTLKSVKENISNYQSLLSFFKKNCIDIKEEQKILKNINAERIYVLDKPLEFFTPKMSEQWFWSAYNKKCLECINNCKQSSIVEIIRCNEYKRIK